MSLNPKKKDFNLQFLHRKRTKKISRLSDYRKQYDLDSFLKDLVSYFDNEVDFNLEKIRQEIKKPRRLSQLIKKANEKNTHPVIEFIQELFQDLGQSGDVKWSGEW